MTKQNASETNSTLNNPLMPVVTPGSQQETQLRQVFAISITLGIVQLLFAGLMLLSWLYGPAVIETAMNTEGMPQEQMEAMSQASEIFNQMSPAAYHGTTLALVIFGIIPGLLYVIMADPVRRFRTYALITLLVLAVMQSFVFGVLLLRAFGQMGSPCDLMCGTILFGSFGLATGNLAWKLFQLRQFQMRHLLALQQGVNAQYRQAQANQVSKMAQDHHENTKHELKRPVEPWDES